MIRVQIEDVPLVSEYLHNAAFYTPAIRFDAEKATVTIEVERIHYENGKKRKCLFLIPVIRYPTVRTEVKIFNVATLHYEWVDRVHDTPEEKQNLLSIHGTERAVTLDSDYVTLRAGVTRFDFMEVRDISAPTRRHRTIDFGTRPLFDGMDDIERLRSAAA
jgi:hypothetical protein